MPPYTHLIFIKELQTITCKQLSELQILNLTHKTSSKKRSEPTRECMMGRNFHTECNYLPISNHGTIPNKPDELNTFTQKHFVFIP